jgi:trk system potassium uptake protein TrkA
MKFVILGCGRVGAKLAGNLDLDGHEVSIIDKDPESLRRLGATFGGNTVTGIGFDRDVLKKAGIERADGFASVTNGDNSNIISAQIAKKVFRVPRVITRIYDPVRAHIYQQFGIPTISPTAWGARALAEHLLFLELKSELTFGNGEVELLDFVAPQRLIGRPVRELTAPGRSSVICLVRLGRAMLPMDATVIEQGDILHVCVATDFQASFKELAGF